ncbi:sugar kinase [Sphingobacterium psychroaquaticum]|uniref:sugar kinase n=1 Tax=Sphingobacterium psychroaquaticum TaxID=561061 RepID=UPI0010691F28|nr:sugar kinase [Sphingobacterium psychroaquaticum]QBQ40129.1 sugar kinase [Sphingobacterium psychroaquaticum]
MKKILAFGEILIRQQSVGTSFFEAENNFLSIYPGGSEANVATALAQMDNAVSYVSAFPENALSNEIIDILKKYGVDTAKTLFKGDRIGTYLLLSANGLSKGEVIYDRKYSSFSQLTRADIDIDDLLQDVDWLHWTALTPALNENLTLVMQQILQAAKERGIIISVDLNYRNKLWQYGVEPLEVMPTLISYCDVIMGNIWAANKMLGTQVDSNLDRYTSKETYMKAAQQSANEIFQKFTTCKHIAYTFRFMDNPTHNLFYGTYHTRENHTVSATHETNAVIDRIGSGDAFMAGFIHALRHEMTPQQIVDTATGAGFQKLFVKGDFGNGKID